MVAKVAFEDRFLFFRTKIWKNEEVYPCDKPTSYYKFAVEKQEYRPNVDFCNHL